MSVSRRWITVLFPMVMCACAAAQDVTIHVSARDAGRPVSHYLTGACIEDVNHEIYGGIYSQMLFGESFAEPAEGSLIEGFTSVDGKWKVQEGDAFGSAGAGMKLISNAKPFAVGEVGVDICEGLPQPGNRGLIVRVNNAAPGADNFDGYEISLDSERKVVTLGRHHHSWKLLKEQPVDLRLGWRRLSVKMTATNFKVSLDGQQVLEYEDKEDPLPAGTVGLRDWNRKGRYQRMWIDTGTGRLDLPFKPSDLPQISKWRLVQTGSARGNFGFTTFEPFVGSKSQRVSYLEGDGEAGITNDSLNHWGLGLAAGKPYEGSICVRAKRPTDVFVALESRDGGQRYAEQTLHVTDQKWQRLEFSLTPNAADTAARFCILLKSPGSVDIGYAFLQPGSWGRFKDLPVRRDVVQGLIDQGITVLRYGGSMANAPEYRWKKMIGPREKRPVYEGHWYPYSTNGWGIIDFLNLCEAAGFLGVPDFNIDESPQDMADFIEYVNGPADSEWGKKRVADGHAQPYGLRYLELGNEERVDEAYAAKFEALAKAIWAKDPGMIPVVGDFNYYDPITDPMKLGSNESKLSAMTGHQQILQLAAQQHGEVWFDVHVNTEGPEPSRELRALPTYIDAIDRLAGEARHKVVVFELNANNHAQRRALANAWALGVSMRDGRLPIVTSANCLQPDKQNDNGWDQGLLFLNPTQVWLQPPGYVTQMIARNVQARVLPTQVEGKTTGIDATATRSEDGKTLVLQLVNLGAERTVAELHPDGFAPSNQAALVEELAGPLDQVNTAEAPTAIVPRRTQWQNNLKAGAGRFTLAPHSFTVIRFQS